MDVDVVERFWLLFGFLVGFGWYFFRLTIQFHRKNVKNYKFFQYHARGLSSAPCVWKFSHSLGTFSVKILNFSVKILNLIIQNGSFIKNNHTAYSKIISHKKPHKYSSQFYITQTHFWFGSRTFISITTQLLKRKTRTPSTATNNNKRYNANISTLRAIHTLKTTSTHALDRGPEKSD